MFEFQNLVVYKEARSFHISCRSLINARPFDYCVIDQLGRASLSVALNIAEGSGRLSKHDRRKYFVIARASVFECVAVLDILWAQQLITEEEFTQRVTTADGISRILYTMIKNLS